MKKTFAFITLLVAVAAFTSCMKKNCGCDPVVNQPVLFQYEYINYAWGYRHHGFLIDEHGKVNGFRQPEKWIAPDSSGMMSKLDLEYNLAQCDTICLTVDTDTLMDFFSKISSVRTGKIIDNGIYMADAGTGTLSAWYWSEKAGKYENVLLITNGDVNNANSHSLVKEIVEWLKSIGEKTNRFYWYGSD